MGGGEKNKGKMQNVVEDVCIKTQEEQFGTVQEVPRLRKH